MNTWQPDVGDAIQGELELEGERPAIRTEDGTLWQLPDDAVDTVASSSLRRAVGSWSCSRGAELLVLALPRSRARAAQGISLILVPFTFVSSAYVPVASMPSGLRWIAEHQPVTYMVDAVRTLAGGAPAEALLGHPASYFITRSLIWSAVIVLVFAPIAIARYRRG
jgi:hypothetical protein